MVMFWWEDWLSWWDLVSGGEWVVVEDGIIECLFGFIFFVIIVVFWYVEKVFVERY